MNSQRHSSSVDPAPATTEPRTSNGRPEQSRLLSAIIGAVVTVVLSVVPLSPVVGGAVAAYLRRGDREEGLRVGALSGGIAAVPILLLLLVVFGAIGLFAIVDGVRSVLVLVGGFLVSTALVVVFVAGLSALGGYLAVLFLEGSRPRDRAGDRSSDPESAREGRVETVGGARDATDAADAEGSASTSGSDPDLDDPTTGDVATGVEPDGPAGGRPT
jgi:hypothetical protein